MTAQNGWGGQHLANAAKYFSAFPVIVLSALQRNLPLNHENIGVSETTLYRLWLFAVFVNSMYSFYWDVAKDWDLHLFTSLSNKLKGIKEPGNQPWGLRPRIVFPSQELYYAAVTADLLFRFTWSLKLSPHLDHFADFESGIFLMECLEVGRRWIWIFFRVETEWVRNISGNGRGEGLLGQEEVLLGDYGDDGGEFGKDDDD